MSGGRCEQSKSRGINIAAWRSGSIPIRSQLRKLLSLYAQIQLDPVDSRSPQHPRIRLITNFPGNPPLLVRKQNVRNLYILVRRTLQILKAWGRSNAVESQLEGPRSCQSNHSHLQLYKPNHRLALTFNQLVGLLLLALKSRDSKKKTFIQSPLAVTQNCKQRF